MKYSERGKLNNFDLYMAGFAPWITPRQILILEQLCEKFKDEMEDSIDKDAFLDFKEQIDYEAAIKRNKYSKDIS